MMAVKALLLENVRTRLYARLKDTASTIVKEIIQREIAERVRKEVGEIWHIIASCTEERFYYACSFKSKFHRRCAMRSFATNTKSWKSKSVFTMRERFP